ncbi:MAG: AsmA family protein [Terriglobia bacterium]
MQLNSKATQPKRRWLKVVAWILGIFGLAVLIAHAFAGRMKNWVKQQALETVSTRFASQVSLQEFDVSIYPRIRLSGRGLVLRLNGHPNSPPLISVARFSADAGMVELIRRPSYIHNITLDGLEIHMPPRQEHPAAEQPTPRKKPHRPWPVVVDVMLIKNVRLELLSNDASKPPRVFVISRLVMHQTALGRPTFYHAWLINPKPPGEIDASGTFGPWDPQEPRETPLTGHYTFTHADLSVFRGIAGILSSTGSFHGALDDIEVQGDTDTPDFSVRLSGNPVHLTTAFHSIVDGTTGNTMLERVEAHFLNTSLTARGGVLKVMGKKGRTVDLQVTSKQARLDDLLRFAIKGNHPPLEGVASLKTRMEIPPGRGDISDRLRLNGQFQLASARFTNPSVNQKVQALSRKGLGKGPDDETGNVLSNLQAKFVLRNSVLTFSNITFTVPGAAVKLSGTFKLQSQNLDFQGTLRMKAALSQIVKGKKAWLLIPLDPFFRRGKSGTVLPIKLTGTADHPWFQLEVGRLLKHDYH